MAVLSTAGLGGAVLPREVSWGPTVELRYRKVSFGQPVLQQFWVKVQPGKREGEWRDVPIEAVE